MKKKISLKEKLRRSNQNVDKTEYLDGNGGTFKMIKTRDKFQIENKDSPNVQNN